jgi:hypothetical protein
MRGVLNHDAKYETEAIELRKREGSIVRTTATSPKTAFEQIQNGGAVSGR